MQTINIQKLNLLDNAKVLDLGCGEGRHCFGAYMHANLDVYGFDLNPNDVQKAMDNFPQFDEKSDTKSCSFGCTDATKLPFADETFDYLICSEVLEHIPEVDCAVDEIIRVTKRKGKIAVSVPSFFPEWVCWSLSKDYQLTPGGHVRIFKYKQLRKMIEERNCKFIEKHREHALHSPYWWLRCLFWKSQDSNFLVKIYKKLLEFHILKKPLFLDIIDKSLNPIMGKSFSMYFEKM